MPHHLNSDVHPDLEPGLKPNKGLEAITFRVLVIVLVASFSFVTTSADAQSAGDPQSFEPCTLTGSNGAGRADALCTRIAVPEDPDQPDGTLIDLYVARIPSTALEPQSDALTILSGGPGSAATEFYTDFASFFRGVLRERDIVVVDQRGTGRSNALNCEQLESAAQTAENSWIEQATTHCLDNLNGAPRFYSTSVAVRDLERVRSALGYDALNLYGISYGTRVGLHYARRYPATTRSLVVDGVVPPGVVLGANIALNGQHVLDALFARCAANADCLANFPDSQKQLSQLRERLQDTTIPLEFRNPITAEFESIDLTYGHVAVAVRLLSYAPETAAIIPLLLQQAHAGQYEPIASQAHRIVTQINGSLSFGMHNSVMCTEDAPFYDDEAIDWPALRASYLGTQQYDAFKTMCAVWPQGIRDEDFKQPLVSDVPTLILSGEFDPITPPSYGERLLQNLSNATHIVAPGQGHGVVGRGCITRLVREFVSAPDPEKVDASCTERLRATPFFLNSMGPSP